VIERRLRGCRDKGVENVVDMSHPNNFRPFSSYAAVSAFFRSFRLSGACARSSCDVDCFASSCDWTGRHNDECTDLSRYEMEEGKVALLVRTNEIESVV
jgi:hypothetical protein